MLASQVQVYPGAPQCQLPTFCLHSISFGPVTARCEEQHLPCSLWGGSLSPSQVFSLHLQSAEKVDLVLALSSSFSQEFSRLNTLKEEVLRTPCHPWPTLTRVASAPSFSLTPLFSFSRSLERCGWIKTFPNVNRLPPPLTTLCHHAREHPQTLALKGEVTGAQSRDHVTALALATAVPPTLAPGLAP